MTAQRTRLESLSADERAALSWHLHSGLSVGQIARRMQQSPDSVMRLILRGSRTLFGTRPWGDQASALDAGPPPLIEREQPRR